MIQDSRSKIHKSKPNEGTRASAAHARRGISLLETVIWIGMFVVVLGAVMSALLYFHRVNRFVIQDADAIASAQKGIQRMTGVIREAAYASNGAYPIVSMAANDFVFYADVDSDSAIERVHYYVLGSTLYQGILNPTGDPPVYTGTETVTTLSTSVRNIANAVSMFSYFDTSGTLMSDLTQIGSLRFVTANVVVDIDPSQPPAALTIRSSAGLRNLVGN